MDSAGDTASVTLVGEGDPGEAVVPVPDPGRGPSHPVPGEKRREGRPSPIRDSGGSLGITTPIVSREVPAVSHEASRATERQRGKGGHLTLLHSDSVADSRRETTSRRGRVPPIDSFDGEPDVLFEDWMPGLLRSAGWSEHDTLIQLAGHLRGRASQEWGLLTPDERKSLDGATVVLRSRLDPSSRALAAQDFHRASQLEGESVADFIRRLEQLFKLAYGRDGISDETRGTLLHGQLQEGLRHEIMKAPAVSGSHGYNELCLASRNEEKCLAELAKRRQYFKTPRTSPPTKSQYDQSSKEPGTTKPQSELPSPQRQQQRDEGRSMIQRKCYNC